MKTRSIKIAISLPVAEYRAVERARKRLGASRSAIISGALKRWIASNEEQAKVRSYVEGYSRIPESVQEHKPFELLSIEALASEEWKE